MGNAIVRPASVLCALLGLIVAVGCDSKPPASTASAPEPSVAVPPPPPTPPSPPAPPQPDQPSVRPANEGAGDVPPEANVEATQPPAGAEEQTPANAPETETVKAQAGVGIKGRSLDEYEGVVVTPVKTYFRAKERISFEIEFPHALNLYKALEGSVPQNFAELEEKVLRPNNIRLPALPNGHLYDWNAETEELLVVRPAKKSQN